MSEEETRYAIRLRHRAEVDIEAEVSRLADLIDEHYAYAWYLGLQEILSTLATFPQRLPLASENHLFRQDARVLRYRYGTGNVVFRIFYVVSVSKEDAPYVYILHVRHASRKPMTRAEARKIEAA